MKHLITKVVSTKMKNTVVVERELKRAHPLYKKILRKTVRIKAHNELPLVVGDTVKIESIRPMSKEIYYRVVEKVDTHV